MRRLKKGFKERREWNMNENGTTKETEKNKFSFKWIKEK